MSKLPDGERGEELKNYIVTGLLRLMRKVPYERIKVTDIVRRNQTFWLLLSTTSLKTSIPYAMKTGATGIGIGFG